MSSAQAIYFQLIDEETGAWGNLSCVLLLLSVEEGEAKRSLWVISFHPPNRPGREGGVVAPSYP